MLFPVYVAFAVAIVFYLVLPVVGGYRARAQWRRFRERLVRLSLEPRLTFGRWALRAGEGGPTILGRFRLYGSIEAIEGERRIWIRSRDVTAIADLGRATFHILAEEGGEAEVAGHYALVERLPWSRVRVFPEGAKVFVAGLVRVEEGRPVFVDETDEPLIVVSYEGPESSLLSRLVAGGRRDNEYWNPLSRVSIALGIGGMGFYLTIALGAEYFPTVLFTASLIAFTPVLSLLPPGVSLFFLYRHFWKKALEARTMRDLLRLPLRFFGSSGSTTEDGTRLAPLPEGGTYAMTQVSGDPGDGFDLLIPEHDAPRDRWVVFAPRDSRDPAARRIAIAGDPESLAGQSGRRALLLTLASALSLVLAIAVNLVLAFILWRRL